MKHMLNCNLIYFYLSSRKNKKKNQTYGDRNISWNLLPSDMVFFSLSFYIYLLILYDRRILVFIMAFIYFYFTEFQMKQNENKKNEFNPLIYRDTIVIECE